MDKFIIEATEETPEVLIDYAQGIIEISGKSLPEDSVAFFIPVEEAIRKYKEEPVKKTIINLRLEYLNSSSQKRILEIISLFENFPDMGMEVLINWYYLPDDDDMIDEGKEFSRMISLPINISPIP